MPHYTCKINEKHCVDCGRSQGLMMSDKICYPKRNRCQNEITVKIPKDTSESHQNLFWVNFFILVKTVVLLYKNLKKRNKNSSEGIICVFMLFSSQETCHTLSPRRCIKEVEGLLTSFFF